MGKGPGLWRRKIFISLQIGIPLGLLAARILLDRMVGYGWGWQMYS